MGNSKKKVSAVEVAVFPAVLAIVFVVAYSALPSTVTVTPLSLFGIIFLSNITHFFWSARSSERASIFSWTLVAQLMTSSVFSALIIFIERLAQAIP
jgi:hypothetical protein